MGNLSLKDCAIVLCLTVVSFIPLPMLYSIENAWYQAILMFLGLMVMLLAYVNLKNFVSDTVPKKHLRLSIVFAAIVIAALIEFEFSALAFVISDPVVRKTSFVLIFISAVLTMPITAKKLDY